VDDVARIAIRHQVNAIVVNQERRWAVTSSVMALPAVL
jgi:hypothetical protein